MCDINPPGRWSWLALALAGLTVGCTCGQSPAYRVVVRYQGFEPGCIRVDASGASGAATRSVVLHVPEGSRDGELQVAVFPDPAWSPTMSVRVEAHELDCDGPVVASDVKELSLVAGSRVREVTFALSAADVDADRYVASPPGRDCADDDPTRHPGTPEVCDGLDQDCALGPDDGLGVGTACTGPSGCGGIITCQEDGGTGCSTTGGLYPDQDGDGAGAPGPAACVTVDAGLVSNQGDCDDGDPFSATGFVEICDRRDNDCDGRADLSLDGGSPCPASPSWIPYSAGGGNHDWQSVWSWIDGGVWVASVRDNHTHQKLPEDTGFASRTCTSTSGVWRSVWADPRTGTAYVVGDGAKMMVHRGMAGCVDRSSISNTPAEPRTLVGFPVGDAGVELYVIGSSGDAARWDGGAGVESLDSAAPQIADLHGILPSTMFAAGFSSSPAGPRIVRFVPPRGWLTQVLPAPLAGSADTVEGIHVVSDRLAYAVTGDGRVLRWDGQGWMLHPEPDAGSLVAVLAFGTSSVFALSASALWEWDGGSWGTAFTSGDPLHDLHGTSPADIWVVGDNGTVLRWPE